ncbi:DNA repair protein RecO [bacterium]|nr:DNA repair protein RecO [bacterium]
MRSKRDRVFVIKSINYSEADKVVTVFGRYRGKFAMLAKGIRKLTSKNRGNIQTFSISDVAYYQALGLPLLIESEQKAYVDFAQLKSVNAQRVLLMLNKLLPEEASNEKLFDSLEVIVNKGVTIEYVNKFRIIFLIAEGLLSDLSLCSKCGDKTQPMHIHKVSIESICNNCLLNDNLEKDKYLTASPQLYSETDFTLALDRYVKKLIEETT